MCILMRAIELKLFPTMARLVLGKLTESVIAVLPSGYSVWSQRRGPGMRLSS